MCVLGKKNIHSKYHYIALEILDCIFLQDFFMKSDVLINIKKENIFLSLNS